jgi:hypothetical protein
MKRRVLLVVVLLLFFVFITLLTTNYRCINKIISENKYSKNNGRLLLSGLASTFQAWGDDTDNSDEYFISKECFDRLELYNNQDAIDNIREVSQNNLILDKKMLKIDNQRYLYINQCIIMKDVKILYLAYNSFFSGTDEIYQITLLDDKDHIIATSPSFIDVKAGLIAKNYENYFWGIDPELYDKIILNIKITSSEGTSLVDYDYLLYGGI